MPIHYQTARLLNTEIFSPEELKCLHEIAMASGQIMDNPRWKEESAIDFAFTSAQIEGNTYTRADTISLLKTGKTANDKRFSEAVMIINLRAAYDYILDNAKAVLTNPLEELKKYHSILMRGLLDDQELGAARRTVGTMIGGSSYLPPTGVANLNRELSILLGEFHKIQDPFAKSIYSAVNLPYLQYFEDGNKRTARVFQNAILLANNLLPVLFPITVIGEFVEATLTYYELGDHSLSRIFTLKAYQTSYRS